MKRPFDIMFSLIAILTFLLPMLVIMLLLVFKEGHAIFFRQSRIGLRKEPFQILKFQTLVNNIPTRTGRILRKTGLDELPQFFNVLKGDMSIVGPRALTHQDICRLEWNDPFHSIRWYQKPGITGLSQLYGGQHKKTSWFWDYHYIKRNHLSLDFGIIIASFLMNVLGKTRVRKVLFRNKNLK